MRATYKCGFLIEERAQVFGREDWGCGGRVGVVAGGGNGGGNGWPPFYGVVS